MEWRKGKFKSTVSFFDQFEFSNKNTVPIKINSKICCVFSSWQLRTKVKAKKRKVFTVEVRIFTLSLNFLD